MLAEGPRLIRAFTGREVHLFHLSKIAADREARALFARSGAVLEDHVYASTVVTEASSPLLPACLPFLFLYMDSDAMLEGGMELLYGPALSAYAAGDLRALGSEAVARQVLETCLCTTAGESILRVVFDREGALVPRQQLTEASHYSHCSLSGHLRPEQFLPPAAGAPPGRREAAQLELLLAAKAQGESHLSFVAEGESHRLYEVRIHPSHHTGDESAETALACLGPCHLQGATLDEDEGERKKGQTGQQSHGGAGQPGRGTQKRVRFDEVPGSSQRGDTAAGEEIRYFFGKF
jgi:hypothetical protein